MARSRRRLTIDTVTLQEDLASDHKADISLKLQDIVLTVWGRSTPKSATTGVQNLRILGSNIVIVKAKSHNFSEDT
jgi:hypothetical protein